MENIKDFKRKVIYQIYPASFKDSNNDGWGDINGIIQKLDYLKDLGIGIIWLSPIYPSPMVDMGYDISNYKDINPLFGTMEDFDNLILEAKKRNIKIVMDLVINHTSTSHDWFKKAIEPTKNKYRDYYIIQKGKSETEPPNNWESCFTGSAWEKIDSLPGYYYLHLFDKTQADLNYHNEDVIKEVEDILSFWLDKGVYGFRCDVINKIYKSSYEDDLTSTKAIKGEKYYLNSDGNIEILKRFRKDVLNNYDTFLVGETFGIDKQSSDRFLNEGCLDMFFEFEHVFADRNQKSPLYTKKFSAKQLVQPIFKWQKQANWIANYLENHDQPRSVSRYGDENKYYKQSSKLLALFLLTLKGTPFIYQGQEIGIKNIKNNTIEKCKDVSAIYNAKALAKSKNISIEEAFKIIDKTENRDHARNIMQWDNSVNAGFNIGHPSWINLEYDASINVENELNDEDSILNFYKKLIKFRNEDEVLISGDFIEEKVSDSLVTYYRIFKDKKYLIILNFSKRSTKYLTDKKLKLLISNYPISEFDLTSIKPYFAGIFSVD